MAEVAHIPSKAENSGEVPRHLSPAPPRVGSWTARYLMVLPVNAAGCRNRGRCEQNEANRCGFFVTPGQVSDRARIDVAAILVLIRAPVSTTWKKPRRSKVGERRTAPPRGRGGAGTRPRYSAWPPRTA